MYYHGPGFVGFHFLWVLPLVLLLFCRDRDLMGSLVNKASTTGIAILVVGVILSLNAFLIFLLVTGGH